MVDIIACRYVAEILAIRRKTLFNQSINQSINHRKPIPNCGPVNMLLVIVKLQILQDVRDLSFLASCSEVVLGLS